MRWAEDVVFCFVYHALKQRMMQLIQSQHHILSNFYRSPSVIGFGTDDTTGPMGENNADNGRDDYILIHFGPIIDLLW